MQSFKMLSINKLVRVVALLALVMAVSCSAKLDISDDYLRLGDGMGQRYSYWILQIMVENPLESSDPGAMAEAIKEKLEHAEIGVAKEFYGALASLIGERPCVPRARFFVSAILKLARDTEKPAVQGYVDFLKAYGKSKYGKCAQASVGTFEARLGEVEKGVEDKFGRLIGAYFGSDNQMSEAELYEAAKKVDFAEGKFKARAMLKVAKQNMPDKRYFEFKDFALINSKPVKESLDWEPFDLVGSYIVMLCDRLQRPLENVFVDYNLARAFGAPEVEVSPRFLKLNEYNRACYTWQKHPSKAAANVEEQLRSKLGRAVHNMF